MATIADYFQQAQLSMAAYASLQRDMSGAAYSGYVTALKFAGMSQKQAEEFADTYSVVDQFTDSESGFSGTVFADQAGNKYFAIRGSEADITDWIDANFLDIGADGIAIGQGIAMFNWLQRLYGVPGSTVAQYVYNPDGTISTSTYTIPANAPSLYGQAAPISVTGHSLGGHLAMMLSRLAPGLIDSVYTYNAPGFDVFGTGLTSEGFFNLLRDAAPSPVTGAIGTVWDDSIMSNWNVQGDIVHDIGFTPGNPGIIFSESTNQGIYYSHLKDALTDSLAIYNLFATLDPALNSNPDVGMPKITDILRASSNNVLTRDPYDMSLENALDALRTLFQVNYEYSTSRYNAEITQADYREDFYTRLYALETYLKSTPLYNTTTQTFSLTVDSLTNKSTGELITAAKSSDLATRYALYKLNPFTVSGTGLYETINTDNSLNLYDSATRSGALTDEYLKDRASFLYNKIVAGNKNNNESGKAWVTYTGAPQHFQDGNGTLAYNLYLGPDGSVVNQPSQNLSNIIFDDWTSNTLTGGDKWDKLYGMDGDDTLTGGQGNDYLEGGQGTDQYLFTAGHGIDFLLDTDHQGEIWYDDILLNGGPRALQGNNVYQSPDGNFTYTLIESGTNNTLIITTPGGEIQVKDYQSSDLGITIQDAPPPTFTSTFQGTVNNDADFSDTGVPVGVSGGTTLDANWINYVPFGQKVSNPDGVGGMYFISRAGQPYPENTIFEALYGQEGDDFFLGNPGAQNFTIDAGAGSDWIISDYNDKFSTFQGSTTYTPGLGTTVYAGAGHDAVRGGFRNDWIDGNTGHDQIIGLEGRDYINGGSGNDWLAGNRDDDILIGGPDTPSAESDNDMLLGGSGSDYIHGGAGDDTLYGDASGGFARQVVDVGNGALYLMGWNGETQTHLIPDFVGASSILALIADAPLYEDGGYPAPGYTPSLLSEDYLDGGAGQDKLFGGVGNDILDGGTDNDKLYGEAGDDRLLGGDGNDELWGDLDNAVFNQDQQITETHGTLSVFTREYATGTLAEGNDFLDGGAGDDKLYGGAGDDVLIGGDGTDTLSGGAGADILDGGAGNDILYRDQYDTVIFRPGDGQDSVDYGDGGGLLQLEGVASDQLQIGEFTADDGQQYMKLVFGADSVSIQGGFRSAAQTIDLGDQSLTQQQFMTLAPVLTLYGEADADTIYGGNQGDTLYGREGDDTLSGQGGNDTLVGGAGREVLWGGEGDDLLDGGQDDDTLQGEAGNDSYRLGWGIGRDTVIDTEGTNVLALDAGTSFGDVRARQEGDNLFVYRRGTDDGLLVKDYYLSPVSWQISAIDPQTGIPVSKDMPTFLSEIAPDNTSVVEDAFEAYRMQLRSAYYSNLAASGFKLQADGKWHASSHTVIDTSTRDSELVNGYNEMLQSSDAPNILRTTSPYSTTVNVLESHTFTAAVYTPVPGTSYYSSILGAGFIPNGIAGIQTTGDAYIYDPTGQYQSLVVQGPYGSGYSGVWSIPSASFQIYGTVDYTTYSYQRTRTDSVLTLEEIDAGASGNTIYADRYSIVDAGAGDDTVYVLSNAPAAPGAEKYGALAYGNDGNDQIHGGGSDDTLIGGAGDDFMDGGRGGDTYVVFAGQAGSDIIFDSGQTYAQRLNEDAGGNYFEFFDWYYASLGIDWHSTPRELLPEPPFVGPTDYAVLEAWYDSGLSAYARDSVEFGAGITLADLQFSWGQYTDSSGEMPNYPDADGQVNLPSTNSYATLDISWSPGESVRVVMPPSLWYQQDINAFLDLENKNFAAGLGFGVEQFKFSDGTVLSMLDMLALASPTPTFDPFGVNSVHNGTALNDELYGAAGDDTLNGLGGDDVLLGGSGNDSIDGGDGNDWISAGGGADVLSGGPGNDTYWVLGGGATLVESANEGRDILWTDASHTLEENVEDMYLLGDAPIDGTGNSGDNLIVGNFASNTLHGGGGNDTIYGYQDIDWMRDIAGIPGADVLDGGDGDDRLYGTVNNDALLGGNGADLLYGDTGADYMSGGDGDDTYVVDNAGDMVVENVGEGLDTVRSSIAYTLGDDVENLVLEGYGINGTGNDLDNRLVGVGYGANILTGGLGNDTYVLDVDDTAVENANEGIDTIETSSFYVVLGVNFENITLTGNTSISGTGNAAANVIVGNAGANQLNGMDGNDTLSGNDGNDTLDGGLGADVMSGGAGDDLFIIDNAGDVVIENLGEGVDTVQSGVTQTLSANVENLTLTGTSAINATGNSLNNVLTGNSAVNTLTGGAGDDTLNGGVGGDKLYGGVGNDVYVVDNTKDVASELINEGVDTVQSSVKYTLGNNVENLVLTGTLAINGTGNTLNNVLTGNSATNTLTGNAGADTLDGGAGNDILSGGAGNDIYMFSRGYGQDTISENDSTAGNTDTAIMGVNPLDIVFVKDRNNLVARLHGSTDTLATTNWYRGTAYQVEVFQASDGSTLANTQVDQLIQAMAQFSANNGGITWDQAIDQNPTEVQAVISVYWQGA